MSMIGVLHALNDDSFLSADLGEGELERLPAWVESVEVDKMWQALSIITTPGESPLASIEEPHALDPLLGGTEFDDDWGYGPPRYLTPGQVADVAAHLASLTDDDARARFDPAAFARSDVYPFVFADEDPDELWEELAALLDSLRGFYGRAASAGHHVVLVLE